MYSHFGSSAGIEPKIIDLIVYQVFALTGYCPLQYAHGVHGARQRSDRLSPRETIAREVPGREGKRQFSVNRLILRSDESALCKLQSKEVMNVLNGDYGLVEVYEVSGGDGYLLGG